MSELTRIEEWIEQLPIQTLTDELKADIIDKLYNLYDAGYLKGYNEAESKIY